MTLIEVLIVLALIALLMGAIVVGSGQGGTARLSHSAAMISGAARIAFARASATSKPIRLVMDIEESKIWLEEADGAMLVQSKDTTGTGGAAAATGAEKQALEESSRIVKGPTPPRPSFTEIEATGVVASSPGKGHKALERGIKFRSVQTGHDDKPRTNGHAYLYFWPGGQTERAAIQLRVGDKDDDKATMTLMVSPLTGKIAVKEGAVPLPQPEDDKAASEREDPGAF
jgi:general secretion pathway protein H